MLPVAPVDSRLRFVPVLAAHRRETARISTGLLREASPDAAQERPSAGQAP